MAPGLEDHLADWADGDPVRRDVAAVLRAIAATTASLAERIGAHCRGCLPGVERFPLCATRGLSRA